MSSTVEIQKETLRAILRLLVKKSEFEDLCWEVDDLEFLREAACLIGQDPMTVTPQYLRCCFSGDHQWERAVYDDVEKMNCTSCRRQLRYCTPEDPPIPAPPPRCGRKAIFWTPDGGRAPNLCREHYDQVGGLMRGMEAGSTATCDQPPLQTIEEALEVLRKVTAERE